MLINILNPATLLPLPGGGTPHRDGVVTTCEAEKMQEDLTEVPFIDPDGELFVDGFSYYLNDNWITGYSIIPVNEVVETPPLSPKLSAQAAELMHYQRPVSWPKEILQIFTLILNMHLEYGTLLGSYESCMGL